MRCAELLEIRKSEIRPCRKMADPLHKIKVIVIGAGIAGLAVTHALRGIPGVNVDVYDRDKVARESGFQLNILPNGMFALDKIGLLPALLDCGSPIEGAVIYDGLSGEEIYRIALGARKQPTEYTGRSYFRSDIWSRLISNLRGDKPIMSSKIVKVIDDPSAPKVVAQFEDGSSKEADIVVAADGINSTVRAQVFPFSAAPRLSETVVLLGWAPIDLERDEPGVNLIRNYVDNKIFPVLASPRGDIVISHAGQGRVAFIMCFPRWLAKQEGFPIDGSHTGDQLRNWAKFLVKDITNPAAHYCVNNLQCDAQENDKRAIIWQIADLEPIPSYAVGRVALVGDAAHAIIPRTGQGANQALEDAMILSREIKVMLSENHITPAVISEALMKYSKDRQPKVSILQAEARDSVPTSTGAYFMQKLVLKYILPKFLTEKNENMLMRYAIAEGVAEPWSESWI